MAVVFPALAGAIASCSRAAEVHICRTSEACPTSRAVPLAAISSTATSTTVQSMTVPSRMPATVRRRCSASRIRCEVYRSAPAML
jgi:hypothetical protein